MSIWSWRKRKIPILGIFYYNGPMTYYTYILHCADSTLYTGITTDIDRRVQEHNMDDKK